jgi:hypothetical protein
MPATKRTAIRAGHIVAFDGRGHQSCGTAWWSSRATILHVGPGSTAV